MNTDREHLDAETVAAWIDGGLDARSLAAAEAHASNCDRCQALLATVAQTLPAESASHSAIDKSNAWAFWKWLTPLAAAAAAVTIWMVVPQDRMQPERKAAPESDVAIAEREVPTAAPSPVVPIAPPVIPESAAKSAPQARAEAGFADSDRVAARRDAQASDKLADAQSNKPDAAGVRDRTEKREVATLQESVSAAPAPPPPAVATTPAPPAEPARDAGAAVGAVAQSQLRKQSGPIEIVSSSPEWRWRVLPATIDYSPDAGRTWIPVRINAGSTITAGASPAPQVCWMVGLDGLVLLATDGTNFTRMPFPERVDLVSVTAIDARRATVTAADGRTFQTTDNGRNWRNP